MVGFTFSSEQLQTAPPDVRRWIEIEIGRALAMASKGNHNHATQQVIRLAECAAEEAAQIFEPTCSNFIAARVSFELGREIPYPYLRGMPQMRLLNVVDILDHVQLSDSKVLIASCDLINQAFQQARGDPEASLFASDGAGHIYIHEITPPQHPTAMGSACRAGATGVSKHAGGRKCVTSPNSVPAGPASLEDRIHLSPEHAFASAPNP